MDVLSVRQLNYLAERYALDEDLQGDKEVTLALVRRNPSLVQYASDRLKNDVDVASACVKSDGRSLRFLSEEMRSNEDVVLLAVENFCASYSFATGKALQSLTVAKAVAKRGGETIELLNSEFLDNEEIALIAVERNPKALRFFSERVRAIGGVVLKAILRDRTAINFASDLAFKSKKIFEKAIGYIDGKSRINSLSNTTPLGVFEEIDSRGLSFSLSLQNLDMLTLDRDKLAVCLRRGEGAIVKKVDLLRKYVLLEDGEIVSLMIEKCNFAHKILLAEIKFASESRKIRALPILLRATRGVGLKESDEKSDRMYLMRSLRRKSPTAMARFKENYAKYLSDSEVIMLAAEADGSILKTLAETEYIRREDFVTACLKSYVVKYSERPILEGVDLNLTYEQALLACARDGRNYYCLSNELKNKKEMAVASVRSCESVYEGLSEELKRDADVLREKSLWIR